jgi:hypothetical protein
MAAVIKAVLCPMLAIGLTIEAHASNAWEIKRIFDF